jgi:hypothetical protein
MGLLDDAIREHLDLKRRRGADPNEVERLEREALGPVRRAAQTSEENGPAQDGVDQQGGDPAIFDDQADGPYTEVMQPGTAEAGFLDEQDHELAEPVHEEPRFTDETALLPEQPHEPFPEDESEKGWAHDDLEALEVEEPLAPEDPTAPTAEPPPPASPPPAAATPPPAPAEPVREADHPGEETVEYDVEAEEIRERRGETNEPKGDDVLEETPEFLQDTPDHDRLWFEQRPPKDFDFDK